jgi:hypothetical protein
VLREARSEASRLRLMGDWYTIGVALGAGVALGVLAGGLFASSRFGGAASSLTAAALGVVAGVVANRWIGADWAGPVAGIAGGVIGALSATVLVRGALRKGGTAGASAFIVGSAALMLFVIALIPVAGYVTAVIVPFRGWHARRRAPQKHAGLRTLAK